MCSKKVENSSDESSNPPSPSPKKQTVQKNLPPLKKKIPTQKNKAKAKCGEEKPACQAKGKKKKNELVNEEGENKGFHIDGNMAKFLEHLDQHTRDLFQSTKEVLDKNLPIIYNNLATVKSFISLLGKIFLKNPHEIDPISGEITLKCKGCLLYCPPPKLGCNITARVTGS